MLQQLKHFNERLSQHPNYRQIKFLVLFGLFYCIFHGLYYLVPDDFLREQVYYHLIIAFCADAINWISANERVIGADNMLRSSKAALEVVRGCDGAGSLFLIVASVLAFSCSVKHKLKGLILGVALIYLLNQIRIIGLYFVVAYQKSWFLPIHTYYAPSFIVMLCVLFFAWWAFTNDNNH